MNNNGLQESTTRHQAVSAGRGIVLHGFGVGEDLLVVVTGVEKGKDGNHA